MLVLGTNAHLWGRRGRVEGAVARVVAATRYPTWRCVNADWSCAALIKAITSQRHAYQATRGLGLPENADGAD